MATAETADAQEESAQAARTARRRETSFAGDVLKLVSGTTFAQALGIVASPFLTRLYGPEAFGVLGLFTSTTGIIGVMLCLRYELSIMLPETDEEAANLLVGSLAIACLMSLLTVPIIWLTRPQIVQVLNAPELGPYLWLVPPIALFGGVSLGHPALNCWATRRRQFGRLSLTRVISSVLTIGAQLAAGYAGLATGGSLIGASVAGSIVSTSVLAVQTWRDDKRLLSRSTRWRGVLTWLKRHYRFPLYSTWSSLMNTVSSQLPTFLLSAFFSPAVAGCYALGHRLLSLPMSLIGAAIGQVFFQRASASMATGSLGQTVESTVRGLMTLAAFPFLLLAVVGPELFSLVFGNQWSEAGVYAQILAPWLFFVFVASPVSSLFSVLEKQSVGLAFNVVLIVTRVASLVVGGVLGDARIALGLFSATGTLLWAGFCLYLISIAGLKRRSAARIVTRNLFVALLFSSPTLVAKWLWEPSSLIILLVAACSALLYYVRLVACDGDVRAFVLGRIPRWGWRR